MSLLKAGGVKAAVERVDSKLSGSSLENKTIKLLGNFLCWFPGGYYRDLKLNEYESSKDKERFEYNKKIAEDLDEAIKECGYSSEAEIIGSKGIIDKNLRVKVLLEVYFKMKDKGYSNRELAT